MYICIYIIYTHTHAHTLTHSHTHIHIHIHNIKAAATWIKTSKYTQDMLARRQGDQGNKSINKKWISKRGKRTRKFLKKKINQQKMDFETGKKNTQEMLAQRQGDQSNK